MNRKTDKYARVPTRIRRHRYLSRRIRIFLMRFAKSIILLNALAVISTNANAELSRHYVASAHHTSSNHTYEENHVDVTESTNVTATNVTSTNATQDWTQYTQGDRADWTKYMQKPGSQGGSEDGQFDWMKFAGPYMGQSTQGSSGNRSAAWNNGQGDGFGEPFRTQTGGDFRYKAGRDGNSSHGGGWEQYAAPYGNVNPQQPGSTGQSNQTGGSQMDWQQYMGGSGNGSQSGQGSQMDWKQYMGGSGNGSQSAQGSQMDWKQYMGGSGGGNGDWSKYMSGGANGGGNDWQQYIPGSAGTATPGTGGAAIPGSTVPQAGGFFEMEVSGKDLNVSTNFGLGQGHGGNSSDSASAGAGGGGGNQNSITAKEGRIFIRGQFLNQMVGKDVVPA